MNALIINVHTKSQTYIPYIRLCVYIDVHIYKYITDMDAYLHRGRPVSVHLSVFVVVTLKLQL